MTCENLYKGKYGIMILLAWLLVCCQTTTPEKEKRQEGQNYPQIGEACPGFTLTDLHHYPEKQASLEDFKGKWLVLDFWARTCVACIKSFPKMNALQEQFKEEVQIVLVGTVQDSLIKPLYEKFREKYDLQLAVAYEKELASRFGVPSYPYIVVIDPEGVVRAITQQIDAEQIRTLMADREADIPVKENKAQRAEAAKRFDPNKPFLVGGNGGDGSDFLYRSMLTRWKKGFGVFSSYFMKVPHRANEVLIAAANLKILYRVAYGERVYPVPLMYQKTNYGEWWPQAVVEVKDTMPFYGGTLEKPANLYCYNLIVPPAEADIEKMQQIMQRDLQNYFGYEVQIETRKMPCWELRIEEGAGTRLQSRGGESRIEGDGVSEIKLVNQPTTTLISIIWGLYQKEPPFIDRTGITGNIDIEVKGILTDFGELKTALQKEGLDLVKGKKEMKVIVIRDQKFRR